MIIEKHYYFSVKHNKKGIGRLVRPAKKKRQTTITIIKYKQTLN